MAGTEPRVGGPMLRWMRGGWQVGPRRLGDGRMRDYNGRMLKLVEGEADERPMTGERALLEVGDLIAARLREVPVDDPCRGELEALGIAAPPSCRVSSRRLVVR